MFFFEIGITGVEHYICKPNLIWRRISKHQAWHSKGSSV